MPNTKVLAIVLAGGEGKRLQPLTSEQAKPAVPFAGSYRLIDFALSNLANAGYLQMFVLTQYKSYSLDRHLANTWRLPSMLGTHVTAVPAQMRRGPHWYQGSADALYQNLHIIREERPDHVIVFGADHVYRMDPRKMVEQHIESGAGVTVAAIRAPLKEAHQFGVIEVDTSGKKIARFREKPTDAKGLPDAPDQIFASMGNYVFTTEVLVEAISRDALNEESRHDIGGNIIPMLTGAEVSQVYDFSRNEVPGSRGIEQGYWRDVGTLDAYYDAHMDLLSREPLFGLYNDEWPIHTASESLPPAKFELSEDGEMGHALDSLVCAGVVVSGGRVRRSILSPGVRVGEGATVEGSILMHGVEVGRGAVVKNAIIDEDVRIPAGAKIGVDLVTDRQRFAVTDNGVVVIGKLEGIKE